MTEHAPAAIALHATEQPLLSVAICTWNRHELLRDTLASLASATPLPDGQWEVIVVDNNSTDETRVTCESFAHGALPLRVVCEERQGHAHSRNRAVAEARGRFILWTDDDVLVSPAWLTAYAEAIQAFPDASFFGGPIEPQYESAPPRWLLENQDTCDGVYARRQLGDLPIALDATKLPYGANFATRTEVQRQFPYQTCFGRMGKSVRGYDEIDVLTRIIESGGRGYWVPGAPLRHRIPAARMTTRYIHDYFFGQGQTWVARGLVKPAAADLKRRIRYHRRAWLAGRLRLSPRHWFGHWVQMANLRGQLDQLEPDPIS
jgi:glycosyltransferase involved in cell wall biosynthesis